MTTFGLIFLSGTMVTGGIVLIIAGILPATPHLADTIARLDRSGAVRPQRSPQPGAAGSATVTDRLGSWMYRRSPLPLGTAQLRALQVRGRSVTEFYAEKALWGIIGLTMPAACTAFIAYLHDGVPAALPPIAALVGGALGYFVPDLMLRGQDKATRSDASSALLMYIDLVTLERLANASGTQALHNAAGLSDVPLFRQLRRALERARLEQQAPYTELRRLADELALPELRDLSDVMQLDEAGAALSGSLRARVRELRDAHLATTLREANASSEGMTIYMTIPAMLLGVMFIVPALMRIVSS